MLVVIELVGQNHGEGQIGGCYTNGVNTSGTSGGEGRTGRCLYWS